jgi:N-acetyl-gamma-glutamyl-phosphate reductase
VGAAGFTGIELVNLLLAHPRFELVAATSENHAGEALGDLYPRLLGRTDLRFSTYDATFNRWANHTDLMFLAVPHTVAMNQVPGIVARGISVIDLSADFRLKDAEVYARWYGVEHQAPQLLAQAVYGLPEFFGQELIHQAKSQQKRDTGALVANPGCYPTATLLATVPALLADLAVPEQVIVVNAISGVSGAGRHPKPGSQFCALSENLYAYGATTHRHSPEIAQVLSQLAGYEVRVQFTPHLAPVSRGMVATVCLPLRPQTSSDAVWAAYRNAYAQQPFVQLLTEGTMPQSASVRATNYAQVGLAIDPSNTMLVASCAIDNLGKGASAQALQCANLIFGFEQTSGLTNLGGVI